MKHIIYIYLHDNIEIFALFTSELGAEACVHRCTKVWLEREILNQVDK